jgi:predicted nucleic acid-binding protein
MKHEIKTIIDCNIIISAGLTNGNCRKIVLEIIENMNNQEYRLPDPKDEMYLHIAILTKSNYIITGNLKDFPKIDYDKVKVLSPKEFVDKIL